MEEHQLTVHTTGPRPCPFGCGDQVSVLAIGNFMIRVSDGKTDLIQLDHEKKNYSELKKGAF